VKRPFLLAALAGLAVLSLVVPKRQDNNVDRALSESRLEDVRVVNKRSGEPQWTLLTKRAVLAEDGGAARMEDVTVEIPDEGMTVTADSGVYDVDNRDLSLAGNIRAVTSGYTITTSSMSLSSAKGELATDDRVVLEGDGFRIEGDGLRTGEQRTVRLRKNVKAIFF